MTRPGFRERGDDLDLRRLRLWALVSQFRMEWAQAASLLREVASDLDPGGPKPADPEPAEER